MTVILDAGHGEETPGKRSPVWPGGMRLYEWEFNRSVVARIVKRLTKEGMVAVTLVPDRHDVSLGERIRRCNKEIIPTANRQGDQCILVSVHANAGGGTGFEVYTSPGKTRSDDLAEMMLASAEVILPLFAKRKDFSDGDGDKEARFYMLTQSMCPAILTENLFMDRFKPDCEFIMSDVGRDVIAEMHVEAIKSYARKYAGYEG
ncbi:MAG: N-acetylmuramoyl-L-alanine amidase [Chlorobiaceae bacterium]|nr:N-acetylmuramoyl-L-alanine amidase [Chlorobiaceae bacterium]